MAGFWIPIAFCKEKYLTWKNCLVFYYNLKFKQI